MRIKDGVPVVQLVEQDTTNPKVIGFDTNTHNDKHVALENTVSCFGLVQ